MSKASVDLPEPLTPEMTLNWPRGMSTLRFLRLCSLALTMRIAFLWAGAAKGRGGPGAACRQAQPSPGAPRPLADTGMPAMLDRRGFAGDGGLPGDDLARAYEEPGSPPSPAASTQDKAPDSRATK